jgi:malonyl-CoA O-methyltransferase
MVDRPVHDAPLLHSPAVRAIERRLLRGTDPGPPWLARAVAGRMAERLAFIRTRPAVVLDVSGWLGASLDVLRQAYPEAVLHLSEADADAARRLAPPERRRWVPWRGAEGRVQIAGPDAPPPLGVQLLWSNLQLGRVGDPPSEVARWHAAVQPGGFVMFSALGPDTLHELHALYAQAGWGPPAAPFVDMHDFGDMLVRAGFADPVMDQERLRLTWPDAEAVLADLRRIGGNAHPARFAGWRTPRWRAELAAAIAERHTGPDGRIAMTIEVAYGHAFRVERHRVRAGEATVSVDSLRRSARSFPQGPGSRHDLG